MNQPENYLRILEFDRILDEEESEKDVFNFFSGRADIVAFFPSQKNNEFQGTSVVFLDISEKTGLLKKIKEIFPSVEFNERPEEPDNGFRDFSLAEISRKAFYYILRDKLDFKIMSLSAEKPFLKKVG